MKIYWTLKSIPELAEMSKKDRKKVWRRCYWKVFRHWQTWFALATCGVCTALGVALGRFCGELTGNFIRELIAATVGGAVGGGIGGSVFAQVAIAMGRRHIREYLNSHDEVSRT